MANDELIRKKDALDALMAERKHLLANGQKGAEHVLTHHGYNVIDELPPVQSDVPDINVVDMISRQAAIDALDGELEITGRTNAEAVKGYVRLVKDRLERLPSAQPDVPEMNVRDMISKQVAMERLMAQNVIMDGSEYHNGFNAGVNRAQEVIRNLPPVQPKHGEWEYHSNPTIGINPETAYCSCCGFRVDTTGNIDFDEYNFCPRCGVKMEM